MKLPYGFIRLMHNYDTLNKNMPAILLYVDLTQRTGRTFYPDYDVRKKLKGTPKKEDIETGVLRTSAKTLMEYIDLKEKASKKSLVKVFKIGEREELVYTPDLHGLSIRARYSPQDYVKLCKQFKDYKDIAKERGCILAIVAFPSKILQYEWLFIKEGHLKSPSKRENMKMLERLARDNNIPYLDMEEELAEVTKDVYLKTGELFWPNCDTHMNDIGNRYTAEIIRSFLEEVKKST